MGPEEGHETVVYWYPFFRPPTIAEKLWQTGARATAVVSFANTSGLFVNRLPHAPRLVAWRMDEDGQR
jgi:hypothetical protein